MAILKYASDGVVWLAFVIVAGISILQSFDKPESGWLYLYCATVTALIGAACGRGTWACEIFAVGFLFCASVANRYVTEGAVFSLGASAYHFRPAAIAVAAGCVAIAASPSSGIRTPSSPWTRLFAGVSSVLALTALAGYGLLSRHYPLERQITLDAVGNVFILLGSYLLARRLLMGERRPVPKAVVTLSLAGMAAACFAGRVP